MKISVIITSYNYEHYIKDAVESVLNQTFRDFELIIIDDCSLDNSTETVEEFMKEDERIILLKHDYNNEGIMITRNEGIRMAKGKYIAMLDADDTFIHKDILKNSLYIAEKGNLDIVEFSKYIFYGGRFKQKSYEFPELNLSYIIKQPELRTKFIF